MTSDWIRTVFLICLAAVNLLAFVLYGIDKRRAKNEQWRIPEKTLLLAALPGGGAGALAGMLFFRHKTRKWKFRILVPAMALLQAVLAVYVLVKIHGI